MYGGGGQGEFEDDGESSGEDSANDLDLTDASEGDDNVQAPVTLKTATVEQKCPNKITITMSKNVNAAKSNGGQPAGNRGNAIAVDVNGGRAAVFTNGKTTGLPNTASNGIKRDHTPKRVDGKRGDGVEVVKVRSGGSAHGGSQVGDTGRNKKRRRRVQESDDDSEDNRGGGRKEVKTGSSSRKKKEVRGGGGALLSFGIQPILETNVGARHEMLSLSFLWLMSSASVPL